MFRLPKLLWELDCGPLGYPGLVVVFWLNPPQVAYEEPWEEITDARKRVEARAALPPWETEFYFRVGQWIEKVVVPGAYTDSVLEEEILIEDAQDVYELERHEGFDPTVLTWALRQYSQHREERLRAESKN